MKALKKISLAAIFAFAAMLTPFASATTAQAAAISTPKTGYTSASQVNYKTQSGTIVNWGARDEDCVFLSTYAQSFYTGSYQYSTMSKKRAGSSQLDAPQSALYSALKSMMKAEHSHETSYGETRSLYRYTDCVSNNYNSISSFYSGQTLSGTWDSGSTWNREHTWPNSKGLGGNDENDIMMLRPTSVKENSSRGNTAYGRSSGYYNPGESVRGDCARIVLYVYVRWGNTGKMWGQSGVMESLNVLLEWMEEDPVDTWEMARNDSVQSITGTRNVFIDYPEYAWLLFGRDIPSDMCTPSGIAANQDDDSSSNSSSSSSSSSELSSESSSSSSSLDRNESSENEKESASDTTENEDSATGSGHTHSFDDWHVLKQPTETESGKRVRTCSVCGIVQAETIPSLSSSNSSNENNGIGVNCKSVIGIPAIGLMITIGGGLLLKKRKDETQS